MSTTTHGQPVQPTAPAATQPDLGTAEPIPAVARQKLTSLGMQGEALDQFLADLEDDPDADLSASLGLTGEASAETAPAAAEERPEPETKQPSRANTPQTKPLTEEEITQTYGGLVASKAAEAGIDINAWRAAFDAGQDTTQYRESMAKALGLPEELVAQYEQGARAPQADPARQPEPLGDAERKSLVEFAGGQAAFNQLSTWVGQAMPDDAAVKAFNDAVANGNADAARGWLAAIMALREQDMGREPELIQGDTYGEAGDVYGDYDELIADKVAVDQRTGQARYDVDPKWRRYVDSKARRSHALV